MNGRVENTRTRIDIRQTAYKPAEQEAVGRRNSPPPENFLKPVCGISVVKRKITPVFTEVISYLVDLKGIEPSNLTDANRALSQLSYKPICNFRLLSYYNTKFKFVKEKMIAKVKYL